MWHVTGTHEDVNFSYILLLQDIWSDNNNYGFLYQKNLQKQMESNTFTGLLCGNATGI